MSGNMAFLLRGLRNLLFDKDQPFVATVAINLGTTCSGFAFSLNNEQSDEAIIMNRDWVNKLGHRTSKTPTCLLLKPDQSFDSFGYKAVERYAYLKDAYTTWNEFLFFEHFKINVAEDEFLGYDTSLFASNGKAVRATTVFAHCIKFLRDEAINLIRQESGDERYKAEDIQWVLTVPNSWTPTAKQFMREAAYEADIGSRDNPGQVTIVFDAEAAALYCTKTKPNETVKETAVMGEPNAQYVIADLGGGCLKVTAFKTNNDGIVHLTYNETGRPLDGVMVNCMFTNLLDELFGAKMMYDYRQLFPADWLKMMYDFEAKKCTFQKEDTKIRVTGSFVSWVNDFRSPSMKRFGEGKVRIIDDEYLCVNREVMQRLFQPLIEAIKDHLKDTLLNKPSLSKVTIMFLVGGLAESPLLYEEIKNVFSSRYCVVAPSRASIAVVHGAVMFGMRAATENTNVVARTYGADCSRRFVQGIHPEEMKFTVAGQEKCKNLFNCFVKKNEIVKRGKRIAITYRPRDPDEKEMRFSFYAADTPDVLLITEPGVTKIGSVVLQSPNTLKGLDRDIEVSLYFVGTDVIATAWDVTSGNIAQTTLNVNPGIYKFV